MVGKQQRNFSLASALKIVVLGFAATSFFQIPTTMPQMTLFGTNLTADQQTSFDEAVSCEQHW